MIKSKPYYWVTCDKCSKRCDYYEHSAFGLWAEEWTAVEYAEADDWITHGDKHFCPDCVKSNRERALNSAADVPALVAALEAVLELHQRNMYDECIECLSTDEYGEATNVDYPCPTVAAIQSALREVGK